MSVRRVALMTATGWPVAISRITVSAITVGRPRDGLSGMDVDDLYPGNPKRGQVGRHGTEIPVGERDVQLGGHLDQPPPVVCECRFHGKVDKPDIQSHVRIGEILHERESSLIGFERILHREGSQGRYGPVPARNGKKEIMLVIHFFEGLVGKFLHPCRYPAR